MTQKKIITARDVMHTQFIAVDGLMTVQEAIRRLREEGVSVILVNKRNEHDAFGIVLLADIAKKVLARDRSPERVNIYEIMSKPVVRIDPELDVRYCARLFDQFGLSVCPVIEKDHVIGMISYGELVLKGLFSSYDQ
ncbi:MAG: CBS domain-containing protein [Gammaproteobacteria bacterium]|nr:CBS domain-containing protein [Gammaproteobacteria bacterium]